MRKNGGSSFGLLFDDAKIYKIYLLQPIFVQKTYFLPRLFHLKMPCFPEKPVIL